MAAELTASKQRGRPFASGTSGNPNGRPKGSRSKLTETFLEIVARDFAAHGAEALAKVRKADPSTYLKLIGSLLPRELIAKREEGPDVDYAELSYEELTEIVQAEMRRRMVQRALDGVGSQSAPPALSTYV